MKSLPKEKDTFDLRMEGMPWLRDSDLSGVYHQVESAYKAKAKDDGDLIFVIQKSGTGEEHFFCMDYIMWEALCGSSRDMGMYLDMFWEHEDDQ